MMNYQDLCIKYNSYSQANDQVGMDSIVQQVMTATGMAYNQARDYLINSICPEYGIVITGGDPCPPSDTNSPFYTNAEFCVSDWCVDGQGNPKPNAHPDCRCCDDCPPTDPNSPFYQNPNEFCPQCGPGGGYAGHIDCKCCPGNTIDVSPWCRQYAVAVDNADFSQMQTIITAVSTTFNISWSQASQLLYDECLCDDNGVCTNPEWVSMLMGTSSSGQKKNYCERCAGQNTAGGMTTGNFPVDINGGFWQYNPTSGTNYCSCCDDNGTGSTIPCKYVLSEGICQKYWAHINNNDTASAMAEVNQFALNEGISSPDAYALVLKCCPDTPIVPCGMTGEMCADYQSFVAGTSAYTLPQLLQHWVNMFALPTMGGYTLTTSQVEDIITRCCTPANPCTGFQDNGCCGKCAVGAGSNPGHDCYQFCNQWGQCCPGQTPPTQGIAQQRISGSNNNPIGMGSLSNPDLLSFTGKPESTKWEDEVNSGEWEEGGFLTDPYGTKSRTQSMEDFINEIP